MGSLFHLPIVQVVDEKEALDYLRAKGVKTIATALEGKKSYFEVDYRQPVAILVGNEGAGLPSDIIRAVDEAVTIPMPGHTESLNAGISTAVVLYEALRQRSNR